MRKSNRKLMEALGAVSVVVYDASHVIEDKFYQADSLLEILMERLREDDDDVHWHNIAWTVQSLLNEIWDANNGQWWNGELAGRPEVMDALKVGRRLQQEEASRPDAAAH
jgi:hypothetical protein